MQNEEKTNWTFPRMVGAAEGRIRCLPEGANHGTTKMEKMACWLSGLAFTGSPDNQHAIFSISRVVTLRIR